MGKISKTALPCVSLLAASLALAGCHPKPEVAAGDWPNFGRDGSEQHYSPLTEINQQNVGQLKLAWHYDLEPGHSVSAPVEADGKLFLTTGQSHIRALDAATGKELWDYDPHPRDVANTLQMSWGSKGLAYWNGRVVIATTDGRVIGLDAATGKPLWEQRQFGPKDLRNTNGPPRIFDGKVIIGHGGADVSPIRGFVTAYDAMTGKQLWRFYTVPGDPSKPSESRADDLERATWKGDWYGKGGGGTAWNAFSYDPETRRASPPRRLPAAARTRGLMN